MPTLPPRASLRRQRARKALRAHVEALASKRYWRAVGSSPEFVVAFIPAESLVAAALDADPSLLDDAFSRGVALASPVTLWSIMKSVALTWSRVEVADDARRIHELSRELYDRLATLAGHTERLRASIEASVKHYNAFAGALESRVLVSARKLSAAREPEVLREPGAIEQAPRPLTAPEFSEVER